MPVTFKDEDRDAGKSKLAGKKESDRTGAGNDDVEPPAWISLTVSLCHGCNVGPDDPNHKDIDHNDFRPYMS